MKLNFTVTDEKSYGFETTQLSIDEYDQDVFEVDTFPKMSSSWKIDNIEIEEDRVIITATRKWTRTCKEVTLSDDTPVTCEISTIEKYRLVTTTKTLADAITNGETELKLTDATCLKYDCTKFDIIDEEHKNKTISTAEKDKWAGKEYEELTVDTLLSDYDGFLYLCY